LLRVADMLVATGCLDFLGGRYAYRSSHMNKAQQSELSNVASDARLNSHVESGAADTNAAKHRSAAAWAAFHQPSGETGHIEGEPDVQQPGGDYATHPENAADEKRAAE
jgi:hypothetical protein